jgi:hypothetical protein
MNITDSGGMVRYELVYVPEAIAFTDGPQEVA